MQWAGVGMWMVLGLSACSPTKTEIGNLNVIPQPQEVSQDIQAHPFVINPQTGIVYPEGNEKLQRTAEFLASYIKEATGITVRTTTEAARKNSIILAVDGSITNKEGLERISKVQTDSNDKPLKTEKMKSVRFVKIEKN